MVTINKMRKEVEKRRMGAYPEEPVKKCTYEEGLKGINIINRLSLVLSSNDMNRIKISSNNGITIDLHNLGTREAMILINNVINIIPDECCIKLIHGYNHGVALKEMINCRFKNPRIERKESVDGNLGATVLVCKSMY